LQSAQNMRSNTIGDNRVQREPTFRVLARERLHHEVRGSSH
jgi:hypothetical protein